MSLLKSSGGRKVVLVCLGLGCALLVCSLPLSLRTNASPRPAQTDSPKKELSEAEMSHMSSDELAKYVFEHHGCGSCHTMGSNGKLGCAFRCRVAVFTADRSGPAAVGMNLGHAFSPPGKRIPHRAR